MIAKSTLSFLKDLKKNNSKEWFDANRKRYETERKLFTDFTAELLAGTQKFDPSLNGLDPKKCLFRINRDIRFSADKSPYKTNFACSLTKGGKKMDYAGYYLHLEPGSIFAGGGVYAPQPDVLKAIRDEIYFNLPEFEAILKDKKFKAQFTGIDAIDKLKNAPKGYEKDHPSITYLVNKHFVVSRKFSDTDVCAPEFMDNLLSTFKAQKLFVDFINRAMENAEN